MRIKAAQATTIAAGVLVLDQASKGLVLANLEPGQVIEVLPFFNLVLVWNRGVSFGLFSQLGAALPWVLVAIALLVIGLLLLWFRREQALWPRLAIALVLGGAGGNVLDRIRFGAVVDFLDFHLGDWHWPAFNLADTAVVCGAAVLLLENLLPRTHLVRSTGRNGS
ncbi:Lipoprotein signal peptidase [bacterium HR40]|nr:Lipoprotein signal peptidase [bacterium HR40]